MFQSLECFQTKINNKDSSEKASERIDKDSSEKASIEPQNKQLNKTIEELSQSINSISHRYAVVFRKYEILSEKFSSIEQENKLLREQLEKTTNENLQKIIDQL